jgi:hypothetical protein
MYQEGSRYTRQTNPSLVPAIHFHLRSVEDILPEDNAV